MGPLTAIDVLVGFSRLVSEGDLPAPEVLDRLADAIEERGAFRALVIASTGPDGLPSLVTSRGIVLDELDIDSMGEELEQFVVSACRCPESEAITLPIVSGGGLFGAVVLLSDDEVDEREVKLVEGLTEMAALALDRALSARDLEASLTELHQSRIALAQKEKLEALGKMAAVVAHEVKNPLASVSGALQILSQRMDGGTSESRVVDMLIQRVGDLSAMLDELLGFARPRTPKLARVPVRALLDHAVETMRTDPRFARMDFRALVDPPEVTALADPSLIRGVLLNLLLNAAQAMDGAGSVEVAARLDGSWVVIRVIDHGPGVPPDRRDSIFEPFVTTKTRGSGLGLAVARQVVEAHEGSLSLESPPSGGATFVVRLPT